MGTLTQHWKPINSAYSPITPPISTMEFNSEDRTGYASKEAVDSWQIASTAALALQSTQVAKMRGSNLLSPPISPLSNMVTASQDSDRTSQGQQSADPQLYPSSEVNSSQAQVPLFSHVERRDSLVEPTDKVESRGWSAPTPTPEPQDDSKPTAAEYDLVASFWKQMSRPMVSNVFNMFQRNPAAHLEKELSYMSLCGGRSKTGVRKYVEVKRPLRPLAPAMTKVKKIRTGSTPATPLVRKSAPTVKRQAPRKSSTASPVPNPLSDNKISRPSVSKASEAQTKPKDVDWWTIEDFCPPTSTLSLPPYNDNPRCMEIKWTQGPIDLSDDPDKNLLHPAEFHVAQILRLSCAAFLTCKRRLAAEKLRRLRAGIAFTKTHAQSVCRIDVNKTSKIWEAMDQVGWWDTKYYKQWL